MSTKPIIKLHFTDGSDELMVHWPSGRLEFMGVWAAIKLCLWVGWTGGRLVVVHDGKETEA